MVKTKTTHTCEVCGRQFGDLADAVACETQPPPVEYPIGLIVGEHEPGDMYEGMTFAVAANHISEHSNCVAKWACRPKLNDSLGDETCGSPNSGLNVAGKLNPRVPTFMRMVLWLKARGLPLQVFVPNEPWDGGGRIVPLVEFLSRFPMTTEEAQQWAARLG